MTRDSVSILCYIRLFVVYCFRLLKFNTVEKVERTCTEILCSIDWKRVRVFFEIYVLLTTHCENSIELATCGLNQSSYSTECTFVSYCFCRNCLRYSFWLQTIFFRKSAASAPLFLLSYDTTISLMVCWQRISENIISWRLTSILKPSPDATPT